MYSETIFYHTTQALPQRREDLQWLEAIPAGVVIIDVNGIILHANNMARELFDLAVADARWETVLRRNIKGLADNGYYLLSHTGKHIVLKTQALPDKKGQIILLLDESDLKKNNESKITLEKIDSIGKLSAALAHQLRTPLSTAMLYASNLGIDNLSRKAIKNYQSRIMKQLTLIKQQIEEVLLVYKGAEVSLEKFDMVSDIFCLVEDFKALYPNVVINTHINIKDCRLLGNRQSLRGAFNNIIDNAISASALGGRIDINVSSCDEKMMIEVKDSGQGMSQDTIAKVMKGFYSTKETGNGLGLSIARSVIEAHQGELKIESEVMQYTKISIILPISKDE